MFFNPVVTEQTTAITDAILAVESLLLAVYLQRFVPVVASRARYWQVLLLIMALASVMGSVAHGIAMSEATYKLLWKPLLILLGLIVAYLVVATIYDLLGPATAKKAMPWMTIMAFGFFAVTCIPGGSFMVFILYEAAGLLFGLGAYGWMASRQRLPGAEIIATGIVLQLLAAILQAGGPEKITLIWPFDRNGQFHLVGMLANAVMIWGVARGFKELRNRSALNHTTGVSP